MTAEEISKLAKFLEISLGDGNYSNLNHNKEHLKQFISDFKHVCKQLNNRKFYMKAYTSLEQSKKLAEILPLESADMYYFLDPTPAGNIYHLVVQQIDFGVKTREPEYDKGDIPCWSLAALLAVLPDYSLQTNTDGIIFVVFESKRPMMSDAYDNPIDACYEMIMRLHELNLL